MKKRPTSFDIAALAGVSQATVSRALSGSGSVSDDVRQRVLKAATELNYTVDVNARKLRSQKINTIAVLVSEDLDGSDSPINPFFLPLIGHILKYANEKGIDVLVSLQRQSENWGLDYGFSRRADGIIFLGYRDFVIAADKIAALTEMGEPWVVFGAAPKAHNEVFIGSDNFGGAHEAVTHLLNSGRKRIVFLGDASREHNEFYERYQGYIHAHRDLGLEAHMDLRVNRFISRDDGQAGVAKLISDGVHFDAVFAAADLLAMGALQALYNAGKKVPDDVAVIGFDDVWAASCLTPALSTVRQDTEAAAKALVDALIDQMAGLARKSVTIPTRLVLRQTT